MNLQKAETLAKSLMKSHLKDRWTFVWNKRKTANGLCSPSKKTIGLSAFLTHLRSEAEVRNTILHEIAHALDFEIRGYSNHDRSWQRIAKAIGCNAQRTGTVQKSAEIKSKYSTICPSCGTEGKVHRLTEKVKRSACGKCCREKNYGRYTAEFKYVIKQNF